MAIKINDKQGARSGAWTLQGRTYTTHLQVITDSAGIGARGVLLELRRKLGEPYRFPLMEVPTEFDPGSFLQSVRADEQSTDDGVQWIVTLEYGPYDAQSQGGAGDDGTQSPIEEPPRIHSGSAKYDEAVTQDAQTGKELLNTAGMPFDPPLSKPVSNGVWTIVRNEQIWDGSKVQLENHVNADEWLGFPPNTVKLNSVSAERKYHRDIGTYWEVTYEIEIRPLITAEGDPDSVPAGQIPPDIVISNGWTEKVLSAGLLQRSTDGTKLEQIRIDQAPSSTAVALDANGRYDPNADPVYIEVNRFPKGDFTALGLPEDLFDPVPAPTDPGSGS